MQVSKANLKRNIAAAQALAISDPEKCRNARFCTHQFKEWAKLNPEEAKAVIKQRAETRAESQRRSQRKVRTHRWVQEPHLKVAHNIRSRIVIALKQKGWRKQCVTQQILGCTWAELKTHFESLFTEGMSWENYGEWQIDHITPLATAMSEDCIHRLNHHTNLQPLWKDDNFAKGDKLDWVNPRKREA